ncbi:glycosyl transferase [Anaerobacillus alkalidiazotrophicus]|uniref:Glycosyl transferase n=1 Tax=Anaerobacillus alkalidiazotrophicus TaxID=472963 RepID=A0A1S2M1Y7_9BACI|nr:glycosyltransferase family 2 protein [Anaerobacillus alkalidiazotrophicus]OIJ18520.1 glycosyl transferase [Anaerobacillus alkalidiazotrophicus]OIJ19999.1 glycosyl transferase [Anaerobacillus alkalidiazotrophicus]
MITISLCMIVKDEEATLWNCLNSAKDIADEMIIVDTGSTDRSKEIAKEFTDKIYDFEWVGDFAAARNYSFSHATMEYILWLDADDVLLPEDQQKLLELKNTLDPSIDSVSMIYNYGFDKYGNVTLSFRRNRLVKRSKNFQWYGDCHVYLQVNGEILDTDICVSHKRIHHSSGRNLAIYEKRIAKGDVFSPRDYYYYAKELMENGFHEKAIENFNIFLNMKGGWREDKIAACGKLGDCYGKIGDVKKQKEAIFKSFEYDSPRPEICCRLGNLLKKDRNYKAAKFWYELATKYERPKDNWGFFNEAYTTWIPHLNLCVCYYYLGNYEKAYEHNEIAREYRPQDKSILYNKQLIENKF